MATYSLILKPSVFNKITSKKQLRMYLSIVIRSALVSVYTLLAVAFVEFVKLISIFFECWSLPLVECEHDTDSGKHLIARGI